MVEPGETSPGHVEQRVKNQPLRLTLFEGGRAVPLAGELFKIEERGPHYAFWGPLPGVDANAVMRAGTNLSLLQYGFECVRLDKPTFPVKFDESGNRQIIARTLQEFVEQASQVVGEAQSILDAQPKPEHEV